MRNDILMYLILSIFISFFLIIVLKPWLSKFVKDVPNERSSHINIIPSGGGLIFIIPLLAYSFYSRNLIFLSLIPLAFVGLIDDIFKISRLLRAFIQFITVIFLITLVGDQSLFIVNHNLLILLIITVFGLTVINIFNFMDGLDGLLAGCTLIILFRAIFSYHPEISILIGSLIAFITYNWNPAKLFMGDVGSTFLGAVYFVIIISSLDLSHLIINLLMATPLLFDGLSCILLRALKKQNIFLPHKSHLYQRLYQAGMKQSTISLIYIGATSFLALISITESKMLMIFATLFIIITGLLINKKYAVKFN